MLQTDDKKVEYIELIYDLVFVYFLGRNNELLQHVEGGFFSGGTYVSFLLGIIVILQIWYFSTLYINRYGDNSVWNTIGLFINMYLIYYMAEGTRPDWGDYYFRYNIAWALILINIAVQYLFRMKKAKAERPWEIPFIKRHVILLLIQAAIILISIPFYGLLNFPLSWVSIIAGFLFILFSRNVDAILPVNFEHLTERVMLFVVFTFGEMIISIGVYFAGAFNFSTFYYSFMALLIVAGLFLSYGFLYNHIIDRNMITTGSAYMLLHVLLLVALNNITAALNYMTNVEVASVPKNILLVASFLVYFLFLLLIGTFSREGERLTGKTMLLLCLITAAYLIVMLFFFNNGYISIAASVLFIFSLHLLLVRNHKKHFGMAIT